MILFVLEIISPSSRCSGNCVFSASSDKNVIEWDVASGKSLNTWQGHAKQGLSALALNSAQVGVLMSAVARFRFANSKSTLVLIAECFISCESATELSRRQDRLLVGSSSVKNFDLSSKEALQKYTGHGSAIRSLLHSPDGALCWIRFAFRVMIDNPFLFDRQTIPVDGKRQRSLRQRMALGIRA